VVDVYLSVSEQFASCVVFHGLSIAVEELFLAVISTSYWSLSVGWVCFLVAGYWQWFVLLPWLWRKWKTRRAAGTAA